MGAVVKNMRPSLFYHPIWSWDLGKQSPWPQQSPHFEMLILNFSKSPSSDWNYPSLFLLFRVLLNLHHIYEVNQVPMGCLGQSGKQMASLGQHSTSFVALHKIRRPEWYWLANLEAIPIHIGYRISSELWTTDNPLLTHGVEPPVWVHAMALASLCYDHRVASSVQHNRIVGVAALSLPCVGLPTTTLHTLHRLCTTCQAVLQRWLASLFPLKTIVL